jgi:hypothetical protein
MWTRTSKYFANGKLGRKIHEDRGATSNGINWAGAGVFISLFGAIYISHKDLEGKISVVNNQFSVVNNKID